MLPLPQRVAPHMPNMMNGPSGRFGSPIPGLNGHAQVWSTFSILPFNAKTLTDYFMHGHLST